MIGSSGRNPMVDRKAADPGEVDAFYHLGLEYVQGSNQIPSMFGDVRYVCMGGSAVRAFEFAKELQRHFGEVGVVPKSSEDPQPIGKTERYSLYKIGPIMSISHGIGMPSMLIALHEVAKLLHYAGANACFIRVGTSGGIGLEPGTMVVAEKGCMGNLEVHYEKIELGQKRRYETHLDEQLRNGLIATAKELGLPHCTGLTCGTDDYYDGQGRMDGALMPWFSQEEQKQFLNRAFAAGVRNFEMEAPAFASFCNKAGIRGAIVCCTLLDRLKNDQTENTVAQLHQFSANAQKLVIKFIENDLKSQGKPHAKLVFSRHGESEWNVANRFTGWVDVDLSEKGVEEGKKAGELLKSDGIRLDACYTSVLKRAVKTCNLALDSAAQLNVSQVRSWRLNERMYGGLTGLDKKETVVKHGAEQVQLWRRSFDLPPPDIEDDSQYHPKLEDKYRDLCPEQIPKTESLKTVIERVMPFWESTIKPDLIAGKTVFVCAHGNSIRAILKHLEGIPDDVIPGLEIPTGTPLVYELDRDLKPIENEKAVAPLKCGRYLGDAAAIAAAAEAVKNQTKVG